MRPVIFFLALGVVGVLAGASEVSAGGRIDDFSATLHVRPDAAVAVEERIVYDFGPGDWHGIIRDIPVRFEVRGRYFSISVENVAVFDAGGIALPFKEAEEGGMYRVLVGDPEVSVSGVITYVLHYTARGAVNITGEPAALYWKITGNAWTAPIAHVSARIRLPDAAPFDAVAASCSAGFFSEFLSCQKIEPLVRDGGIDTIQFSHVNISPGEGVIASVTFPASLIEKRSLLETVERFIARRWLPILAATWVLVGGTIWFTKNQRRRRNGAGDLNTRAQ